MIRKSQTNHRDCSSCTAVSYIRSVKETGGIRKNTNHMIFQLLVCTHIVGKILLEKYCWKNEEQALNNKSTES